MKYLSKKLFTAFLITFLFGINNVQAFSFNFSSDDDYYGNPYWGNQGWNAPNSISNYRPWIAPDGSKFYPRLPYYQRSKMIESRQK
ncbi:MAG: hypothetical protein ISR69_10345, partial [Gammaproteobacteria bacterium]|nr:hypothetical protein [Gammaproteobacteria bacterium]